MEDLSKKNKDAFLKRIPALKTDHCLDINLIGLFLEKKLPTGENGKVEEHIKECLFCLSQLNELSELIHYENLSELVSKEQISRFTSLFERKTTAFKTKEPFKKNLMLWVGGKILEFLFPGGNWKYVFGTGFLLIIFSVTSIYLTFKFNKTTQSTGGSSFMTTGIEQEIEKGGVDVQVLDSNGKEIRKAPGIIIDANGLILTRLSDLNNAHSVQVSLKNGTVLPVSGFNTDLEKNLAVLKVNRSNLTPVKIAGEDKVNVGDQMINIPDPLQPKQASSFATITNFFSGSKKSLTNPQFIQLANKSTSNKRGVLLNPKGEVLGLVISQEQNTSYAVLLSSKTKMFSSKAFKSFPIGAQNPPQSGEALSFYMKGIRAYETKNYDQGIEYLKEAIRLNPKLEGPHLYLGGIYYELGQFDLETHEYEAVLKINPENTEARDYLAQSKDQAGLYEEAIHEYETLLKYVPGDRDALYELGIDYLIQGEVEKAERQYEALKFLNPGSANKLKKMIDLLKKQKQP